MLLIGIIWCTIVQAQSYIPVNDSCQISFTIKNLGIKVKGSFTGLQGIIQFDPAQPENSAFDVQLDAASVNTGNHKRDEHLRQPVFWIVLTIHK
ncbi:YceI family protein [Paraflavitalea speifideaquila]|uniref:YceI family protein n=1 Tax=Paraflavitalea speifideaquila TaxID=3076558 RepID=UPI0028E2500D|nr:YceI family protein [Paraflavitalea speifideiaquila]